MQGQENNYPAPTILDPVTVTVTAIQSNQNRDADEDQNFTDEDQNSTDDDQNSTDDGQNSTDDDCETDDSASVNKSLILAAGETILRTVCTVSCIGVLISAAVALPAIDQVEKFYVEHHFEYVKHGFDYEDADSYRGAAGWLVFVGSAAIPYNILMVIFRILYFKSILKTYFILFALINGILSVLFALSLLVGGIVSAVYASDNGKLWVDLCSNYNVRDKELGFCDDLQRVATTESAAGGLSFLATVVLIVLVLLMIYSGIMKAREVNQWMDYAPLPQFDEQVNQLMDNSPLPQIPEQPTTTSPVVQVNISQTQNVIMPAPSPSQPSANTSEDHVIPSAPLYPLADVSSYPSPSAPLCPPANIQSYGSTDPPPYELAVATPQYVPSGCPPSDFKTGTAW